MLQVYTVSAYTAGQLLNTAEEKLQNINSMPLANRIVTPTFANRVKPNDALHLGLKCNKTNKKSLYKFCGLLPHFQENFLKVLLCSLWTSKNLVLSLF